jgi:hypothetical protein
MGSNVLADATTSSGTVDYPNTSIRPATGAGGRHSETRELSSWADCWVTVTGAGSSTVRVARADGRIPWA